MLAFCLDKYVFKAKRKYFIVNWKLVQCVKYVGQRLFEDKNVILKWKTKKYHTVGSCYWYL